MSRVEAIYNDGKRDGINTLFHHFSRKMNNDSRTTFSKQEIADLLDKSFNEVVGSIHKVEE